MSETHNQSLIGVWLGDYFARSSELSFPSGAVLQIDGDKIVGRVEPEPNLYELVAYALALATDVPSEPEPIRPALTWNTETPFDTFGPEFVVKAGITLIGGSITPPTDSAHPANANLLVG